MKKAFSLLEVILVITILSAIVGFYIKKQDDSSLENAANRILLYLKQARYQSLIDNKNDENDSLWHKKRWTLKFLRCNKNIGGLYYSVYSDENKTGQVSLDEALADPLNGKKIYSTNRCEYRDNTSKYVLLTKEFGIKDVDISCNSTTSLGQISFGNDGKVYSKLSAYDNQSDEYEINSTCIIKLIDEQNNFIDVQIEANTGFAHIN